MAARLGELSRIQLPDVLAAAPGTSDDPGAGEHVKVLRDGLPGHARARGKASDGCRTTRAQARDETQARLVPERREQRSGASETGLASGSASAPR